MTTLDLEHASFRALTEFDFRASGRDMLADVRTVQSRVDAFLDGVADPDWDKPVSESAVPGAPPWTLRDHVGHVADWNDEACRYVQPLLDGSGGWPPDEEEGGFDAWNEGRRPRYAALTPTELRAWHRTSADRVFEIAQRLPPELAASDGAWEWVWHNLTSHPIEHLAPASVEGPIDA